MDRPETDRRFWGLRKDSGNSVPRQKIATWSLTAEPGRKRTGLNDVGFDGAYIRRHAGHDFFNVRQLRGDECRSAGPSLAGCRGD